MAGSLIKITETTLGSAASTFTMTGIDNTYNVYVVKGHNIQGSAATTLNMRFTSSGTAVEASNYQRNVKELRADQNPNHYTSEDVSSLYLNDTGTTTGQIANFTMWCFNFSNADEYSFATMEMTAMNTQGNSRGRWGNVCLEQTAAHDGIQLFYATGDIATATLSLYGLKK